MQNDSSPLFTGGNTRDLCFGIIITYLNYELTKPSKEKLVNTLTCGPKACRYDANKPVLNIVCFTVMINQKYTAGVAFLFFRKIFRLITVCFIPKKAITIKF